ncbi:MAG: response regulator [Acidobacteriota bacterium]|jgi:excisionase family DNA binding protein
MKRDQENPAPAGGEASDLLTTGDIARYCSVSTNAVKKWIRQGDLPAFQTPGRHFRVLREDFRRFLLRHGMPVSPGFFPGRRQRVLIADDEAMIRELVQELVISAAEEPVEVETAADGYEALLKVGSFQPDLLILDLKMPRMDGFEACRSIRANPEMAHVRILAISGFAGNGNRERILDAGAVLCFDKPLAVAPFQEAIRRLLQGQAVEVSGAGS